MRASEQAAEVLVTGARFDEDGENDAVFHGEFAADDRADAVFFRGGKKSRRAVNAVAVAEGHGGHAGTGGGFGELLRSGGAAQKAERAAGMEFDVAHQSYTPSTNQPSGRRHKR